MAASISAHAPTGSKGVAPFAKHLGNMKCLPQELYAVVYQCDITKESHEDESEHEMEEKQSGSSPKKANSKTTTTSTATEMKIRVTNIEGLSELNIDVVKVLKDLKFRLQCLGHIHGWDEPTRMVQLIGDHVDDAATYLTETYKCEVSKMPKTIR